MATEPLRTTTFTLTRADALAYEQAAARPTPLGVLALVLWLGLCAGLAFLVPPDWAGARLGWGFSILVSLAVAIGYVLVLLGVALRQWARAGRRLRRPAELTVGEWPDRLDLLGGGPPRALKLGEVREAILTRSHLFLVADEEVVILPRRAFAEAGALDGLAARIAGRPMPVDPAPASA